MAAQRRELGKRIAEARTAKRWKQKELAAAVHVEPTTVSRWETGRHTPDIDVLEEIARVTDRPISFFLDANVVLAAARGEALEPSPAMGELVRRIELASGELAEVVARLERAAEAVTSAADSDAALSERPGAAPEDRPLTPRPGAKTDAPD